MTDAGCGRLASGYQHPVADEQDRRPSVSETINGAVRALVAQGTRLCFTSQTLGEFWNASTRPLDKRGFGLSVVETDRIACVIERDFEFLPDSRDVHDRWRQSLPDHSAHPFSLPAIHTILQNKGPVLFAALPRESSHRQ